MYLHGKEESCWSAFAFDDGSRDSAYSVEEGEVADGSKDSTKDNTKEYRIRLKML